MEPHDHRWEVHDIECNELAAALVERIRRENPGIDLRGWVLHSDNGGPMKRATMLATLQRLSVVPSFSRPSISDDNPYVESLFSRYSRLLHRYDP